MFRYDRLDELVKETGKKKNYLGQKMGYSGRYLNDAKKQNTDIKGEPLQILADELETTPEYLTGLSEQKEKPAGQKAGGNTQEFMELFSRLSPEDQAREIAYLRERVNGLNK